MLLYGGVHVRVVSEYIFALCYVVQLNSMVVFRLCIAF